MSVIDPITTARELATHANDIQHLQEDMDKMVREMQEIKIAIQAINKTLSEAKGIFKNNSDIDLCIIKDTDDKRKLLAEIYVDITADVPFDLVLYTVEKWNKCVNDENSFAYLLHYIFYCSIMLL